MENFNWRPGIGDPTVGGWLTVVLYCIAVVNAWRTWRTVDGVEARLWGLITVMFIGLGINKQLDLQTALTEFGRIVAHAQGWYQQRQTVQIWFIIAVLMVCTGIAVNMAIVARRSPPPTWLGIVGVSVVLGFVVIRAASFHHIDRFIGSRILGLKWNWVLEMGGISLVILASEWRLRWGRCSAVNSRPRAYPNA